MGGADHSATITFCGDAGDVVEVTLSGLDEDLLFHIQLLLSRLDGTLLQDYGADHEFGTTTYVAPPFAPLPESGCFILRMSTQFSGPGEIPAPFSYLVTW